MKGCKAEFLEPTFFMNGFQFQVSELEKKEHKQLKSQFGMRPSYSKSFENQPFFKRGDGCVITEKPQIILFPKYNWTNRTS